MPPNTFFLKANHRTGRGDAWGYFPPDANAGADATPDASAMVQKRRAVHYKLAVREPTNPRNYKAGEPNCTCVHNVLSVVNGGMPTAGTPERRYADRRVTRKAPQYQPNKMKNKKYITRITPPTFFITFHCVLLRRPKFSLRFITFYYAAQNFYYVSLRFITPPKIFITFYYVQKPPQNFHYVLLRPKTAPKFSLRFITSKNRPKIFITFHYVLLLPKSFITFYYVSLRFITFHCRSSFCL